MFNVSPVTLDNTQQILNLAINFRVFCWSKEYADIDRKSIFKLLLLSIATSFKVEESDRGFKSEYVISQLIMLACMKKGLSGLTYYSKQVKNDNFAYSIGVNLALFAYYSPGRELSDTCSHISISDSVNYSMYKQLTIVNTNIQDVYSLKAALCKSDEWKYEQEWRYINILKSTLGNPTGTTIPYFDSPISAVYFGAKTAQADIDRLLNLTSKNQAVPKYYHMEMLDSEYKLIPKPLN